MTTDPSTQSGLLFRHRQLSPSANVKVSPLCLGAMSFGQLGAAYEGHTTKEDAFAVMDAFYSQGGNFVDTANGYQKGQSEKWIGEWIKEKGVRDQMVIATKYAMAYKVGDDKAIQSNYQGTGSKSLHVSVAASLANLQTDYLDILYVHFWDYATSIPELMHSLNRLVVAGKVLYLGISDTPAWVVSKANQYARDHALAPFVVYQGKWSAASRDFERDIIPMCKDEGMALAPWGALNQGRFQTEAQFAAREKAGEGRQPATAADKRVSAVLEAVAGRKGEGCTLFHVALAYVRQKAPYVFPIVGCRTVAHLQGSIEGLRVALSEEEVFEIDEAEVFDHGFPHTLLSGSYVEPEGVSRGVGGPGDVWVMTVGGAVFDWVEEPKAIKSLKVSEA